jgi:hypothetical protein
MLNPQLSIPSGAIMEPSEAREILGKDGVNLTDQQLKEVIQSLDSLCQQAMTDMKAGRLHQSSRIL